MMHPRLESSTSVEEVQTKQSRMASGGKPEGESGRMQMTQRLKDLEEASDRWSSSSQDDDEDRPYLDDDEEEKGESGAAGLDKFMDL